MLINDHSKNCSVSDVVVVKWTSNYLYCSKNYAMAVKSLKDNFAYAVWQAAVFYSRNIEFHESFFI